MLCVDPLPDLPQCAVLRHAGRRLWAMPTVQAVWLGGSLAGGNADAFSDVDLRVALRPTDFDGWDRAIDADLLGQPIVGRGVLRFGGASVLHHLVLADATIVDLLVLTTEQDHPEHAVRLLAARDDALAARVRGFGRPVAIDLLRPDPAVVRQLIVDNWVISLKHRKVLARGLELMTPYGLNVERTNLVRLHHLLATGTDLPARASIHTLTSAVRAVQAAAGPGVLAVVGGPTRDSAEIVAAVRALQDELGVVGRRLAERLGFDYPADLERSVRLAWAGFVVA